MSILSKSRDTFLKELSIQSQSTPTTRTSSISCLLLDIESMSSSLEYIITSLQLYDHVSRRSYLAPKEREVVYDQQYSVFLKPERLLLRTIHTTTLVDSTFLIDIKVSLLLDPLALKFKQSCAHFKPQND